MLFKLLEKNRLGPGQMFAIDLTKGILYKDQEIKQLLAEEYPYQDWIESTVFLDDIIKSNA